MVDDMNPILDGDYADPAVFREGETYYLTVLLANTGQVCQFLSRRILEVGRSLCDPLEKFEGSVWAPDILKLNGKYYIYFCAEGSNWVYGQNKLMESGVMHIYSTCRSY